MHKIKYKIMIINFKIINLSILMINGMVSCNLKGNIYMEKEMEKEKSIIVKSNWHLKENIKMKKEMEI